MQVLKLGGSVVTRKDEPETLDEAAIAAAADAIAGTEDVVVVHGGGSFGHHHAEAHGVTTTAGTRDPRAVLDIHRAMKDLNAAIVDALDAAGVGAVPVHPLSGAARDEAGTLTAPVASVGTLQREGFVPVVHGDVIGHAGSGATIVSGDELVVELARELGADRVGLCSSVPGVLDADGAVIDRIETFESVADALGGSDATDVTGGMAGKVRTLLSLSIPASIFGPDDLGAFLDGGRPGTLVADGEHDHE